MIEKFIAVTDIEGERIYVRVGAIRYIHHSGDGATLYFSNEKSSDEDFDNERWFIDRLAVEETPEQILSGERDALKVIAEDKKAEST